MTLAATNKWNLESIISYRDYQNLHSWVRAELGKPLGCSNDETHIGKYNWANISKQYKHDLTDFKSLCISCHKKFDMTDETRKRLSLAKKGNTCRRRAVKQYSRSGGFIGLHVSIRHAARAVGILRTSISNNLAKRSSHAGGYVWRYAS